MRWINMFAAHKHRSACVNLTYPQCNRHRSVLWFAQSGRPNWKLLRILKMQTEVRVALTGPKLAGVLPPKIVFSPL